jgi:hypothetical protein
MLLVLLTIEHYYMRLLFCHRKLHLLLLSIVWLQMLHLLLLGSYSSLYDEREYAPYYSREYLADEFLTFFLFFGLVVCSTLSYVGYVQ